MEVKEIISEKMCRHHSWDILVLFYLKPIIFLRRKNVRHGKPEDGQIPKVHGENLKARPIVDGI